MFISILDKLVSLNTRLISGLSVVFFVASVLVILTIIDDSVNALSSNIQNSLIGKGATLSSNNALAMTDLAADNSINAVGDLVDKTVQYDADIIYGIYMDARRVAWVQSYTKQSYALFFGISEENNINAQTDVTIRLRGNLLEDSLAQWASDLTAPSFRDHPQVTHVIEFAAPVVIEGRRLGTIRYGLNAQTVWQEVEKNRTIAKRSLFSFCLCLLCLAVTAILGGRFLSRKLGRNITAPIHLLATASSQIAQGEYHQPITCDTEDEIKLLSDNFESMRCQVRDHTENLSQKVKERTAALELAQQQALENAHKAGMAEIASGTIHNIGNILNSVTTSTYALRQASGLRKHSAVTEINTLFESHSEAPEFFFQQTDKGMQLLTYYHEFAKQTLEDEQSTTQHLDRLSKDIQLITDAVNAQQEYATTQTDHTEHYPLRAMIQEALILCADQIKENNITINHDYDINAHVQIHKNKFLHVLVNLILNSIEALAEVLAEAQPELPIEGSVNAREKPQFKDAFPKAFTPSITLATPKQTGDTATTVRLDLIDNGPGIAKENFEKIFQYGYTTKPKGHGFGLHTCANYMVEMGGRLWAEETNQGAKFCITLKKDETADADSLDKVAE